MGRGFKHGAGSNDLLNFSITRYQTEEALLSAVPEENTIGIVSVIPVTGWVFSAETPEETTDGLVWIETGKASPYVFNALKEQTLQLYPLLVRQYGAKKWSYVPAFAGKNGQWNFWWSGQLYCDGNAVQRITGGWEAVADAGDTGMNAVAPTVSMYSTYMLIKLNGYNQRGYAGAVNMVDITEFQEAKVILSNFTLSGSKSKATLEIVDESGATVRSVAITSKGTYTMDISDLIGAHYVRLVTVASTYGSVALYVTGILLS